MLSLLAEGGKCIYVAPSGGRDRPDASGHLDPARFDPQSIDLFLLIAKKSKCPTHFHLLTLSTYSILPPPPSVENAVGEQRLTQVAAVFAHFDQEIDMEALAADVVNKQEKSQKRAERLWMRVKKHYDELQNA
jgi:glycerol-3-phosphate O-acyltransferase